MTARVFISHSHADKHLRDELGKHLDVLEKQGVLRAWHGGQIGPGENRRRRLMEELELADLIVLLVSADFLVSEECAEVTEIALRRRKQGAARVVPVLLRPCLWDSAPIAQLQALPRDAKPVTVWESADEAWLDVARGLRELMQGKGSLDGPGDAAADEAPVRNSRIEAERIALLSKLEDALSRKKRIAAADDIAAAIDQEIRDLKRQIRGGGQVRQGDCLGGRYSLHRRIGKGGFATVWEAEDRQRGGRVAVKVLHSNLAEDPERRDRFFRGARVMTKMQSSGVVKILVPEAHDDGFHYFVMEYVAGGDLHYAVRERRLQHDQIVPLLLRVGDALATAHAKGYVHRDVKPHNILLASNDRPKLTDFDLVSAGDTAGGTRTGAMGTFLYAAPEVMTRPQGADERADVYGLGMTAAFCYLGEDLPVTLLENKQRFFDELPCSDEIREVLRRAVTSQAELRFRTMTAFCDALRRAASALESTRPGPPLKNVVTPVPVTKGLRVAGANGTPSSPGGAPPKVKSAPSQPPRKDDAEKAPLKPAGGTTTSGSWPRVPPPDPPAQAAPPDPPAQAAPPDPPAQAVMMSPAKVEPRRVLVVEDDEIMRRQLAVLLRPFYEVSMTADGVEGFELASASPKMDLIVASVAVPRLDGVAMVRELRKCDATRRTPVILLSPRRIALEIVRSLGAGTVHCFVKPVNPTSFKETVDIILRRSALPTAAQAQPAARAMDARQGVEVLRSAALKKGVDDEKNTWILWVDDHPGNTVQARQRFKSVGLSVALAISTDEALEKLANQQFAAVVSDMVLQGNTWEGHVLLEEMRKREDMTPFYIYTSANFLLLEHKEKIVRAGGQGCTSSSEELLRMVMSVRQGVSGPGSDPL